MLFGHEKGAFTGADSPKTGLIRQAEGGTLFLDEVGELAMSVQSSFLRVLQERRFRPVGGHQEIGSDFRLIAATNRELNHLADQGQFRRDLLFRLHTISIELPRLRERVDDIKPLVFHHAAAICERYGVATKGFAPEFLMALEHHTWPGNVRELRNVVERAVLLFDGKRLDFNLPAGSRLTSTHPFADTPTMDELQRRYIRHVLESTEGRIRGPEGAAERLGMKRTTLYARMKKLGMT